MIFSSILKNSMERFLDYPFNKILIKKDIELV
jgi:hypothetical protein